ncbi:MAG: tetraacyldisaccharide 4'-kinase [Bacteriovoracales bacterium]|nr:tetraacyldisaccharide 4'-kinase [Bacteriovoracales bacterium]
MIEFLKSLVITPLAFLWEGIYRLRRYLYQYGFLKRTFFQMPIISVGNIAFGGTGKTPFTLWLTKLIGEYGLHSVVLTRGYKGRFEHSCHLIEGRQAFRYDPLDFGDEPLMLARHLTDGAVIVGKRRAKNLSFFFDKIKPDVGVLDDGFQHLGLFRNFDVVLFDAAMPLSQYNVAPKGYLREGLTSLKDADAIVLSRCDQASPYNIKRLEEFLAPYVAPGAVWVKIKYRPQGLYDANFEKAFDIEEMKEKKVVAVAAIASPKSFFKQLEDLEVDIAEKVSFPDHYYFSLEDVEGLLAKAKKHDGIIIASEKDIIKIRRISMAAKVYYIPVEVDFISGKSELKKAVTGALKLDSL